MDNFKGPFIRAGSLRVLRTYNSIKPHKATGETTNPANFLRFTNLEPQTPEILKCRNHI